MLTLAASGVSDVADVMEAFLRVCRAVHESGVQYGGRSLPV
jgi:hypothetical protein